MRMMLTWKIPVERGNAARKDGTLARTFDRLMAELKPEAAYFLTEDGQRAGVFVFDATDSSQLPLIAEPLFTNLDAAVSFMPVMNADELKRSLAQLTD